VNVRAVLDEELHHSCVAISRCQPQSVIVNSVYIRAVLDEELHHSRVAILRCPSQC
jgi:hypothetical protein